MALTLYCPKCAEPNLYTSKKPIVCGFCGNNLNSFGAASVKTRPIPLLVIKPKVVRKQILADIAENEEDEDAYVPNISQLDVDIIESASQKITIADLAGTPKTGFNRPNNDKILTRSELEQEFKREAGSSKQSIEISENEQE